MSQSLNNIVWKKSFSDYDIFFKTHAKEKTPHYEGLSCALSDN